MPTYKITINSVTPTKPGGPTVAFSPNPITIETGDLVFWSNNTSQMHQPAMKTPAGVFNLVDKIPGKTGDQEPGQSGLLATSEAGTINYFCSISGHTETGTINVQDPPADE
jgi:plastocyanin